MGISAVIKQKQMPKGGKGAFEREGLLHLFFGNVLFMLISHSFLP